MSFLVSVVLPTHQPHSGRLERTLAGLRAQTLAPEEWETLVIDNGSAPPLEAGALAGAAPANFRVLHEPEVGLTHARRRGLTEVPGEFCVLVDDDNVLAPDYLAQVVRIFGQYPSLGAIGGKSLPEFEQEPAGWIREFFALLALRDLGDEPRFSRGQPARADGRPAYPACAPIGAGMALRRKAAGDWLAGAPAARFPDRRANSLSSSGDNDIVLTLLEKGWDMAYFPELRLTHLIPAARLGASYLGRLNRGIQKSWMEVLAAHDASPWGPIAPWTVKPRQIKAWFSGRAWAGPAARVRWQGSCGHFEGRARRGSRGATP